MNALTDLTISLVATCPVSARNCNTAKIKRYFNQTVPGCKLLILHRLNSSVSEPANSGQKHRMNLSSTLILQEKSAIFSCKICLTNMAQTSENKILNRIRGTGSGWAFSPRDFLDLGERATIDSALHRLAQKGQVRRVIRGIYDYPHFSELLKQQLSPDIDQVARAFARKFRWRIQPNGATALNLLGLSTQVPARAVYLSDGPNREYKIGNTSLLFEHTALKEAGFKLRESGLIVQALRSLEQQRVTPEVILKIRTWLPTSLRPKVLADTKTATGWVYAVIQQIAQEEKHG